MKVLLIWPSFNSKRRLSPILGLASIASCLEEEGHSVKLIDVTAMNYNKSDVETEIRNYDPEVVGISAPTQFVKNSYSLAKYAKEINPNCLTILGGAHPSALPIETLNECRYIDVIVRRDGEKTIVELLKNKDFDHIKGITYQNDGKIKSNVDRKRITNLDELPLPAYHLLPMDKYRIKNPIPSLGEYEKKMMNFTTISTCRGCPYDCAFCSSKDFWGKQWITKSPERIIEEIEFLKEKYNVKLFHFVDDTFTVDFNRLNRIHSLIKKEKIDVFYGCSSRANLFTKNTAEILKKSGCYTIDFGFESGVQKILDFLSKGITIQDTITAVKNAKQFGIGAESNFIIGVPGETKRMIQETLSFAFKLNLDFTSFSVLVPFPGTKIYQYAVKNNLLLTKDWSKYKILNPVMKIPGLSLFDLKGLVFYANLTGRIKRSDILRKIDTNN